MDKPVFPPAFWRGLARENPLGRRDIYASDAEDWFNYIWPIFREYTGATTTALGIKRRVVIWWHRLDAGELDRARARGAESRRGARVERLTQVASKALPSEPQQLRKNLPPLRTSGGGKRG